jgi:thioredoxin 1
MLQLLFFTGSYCPTCKAMYPIIQKIKEEYGDTISVSYFDVMNEKDIVLTHDITTIPTLLFIKNNEVISRLVGAQVKSKLVKLIESYK